MEFYPKPLFLFFSKPYCPEQSSMSTIPSPQTTTISTFASPRTASRPRVIPLFATTVQRRRRRTLVIHEDLRLKPSYHPYPQTKRSTTPNASQPETASASSGLPSSPLTPTDALFPNNDIGSSRAEPRPILIPPPPGTLTVSTLNLHTILAKRYRVSVILWT